ncbi:hypothetical protein [Lysobacter humi (ex Lee et al. 2017)]
MFEGFFGYLFGGAIVGILARILKPGPENVGLIMTIVIGAIGGAVGGHFAGDGWRAWAVAIASAIALLYLYQLVFKARRRRRTPADRR